MFKSELERKVEKEVQENLGPASSIDSSAGQKGLARFYLLQSIRQGKTASYTLYTLVFVAIGVAADLIVRIIDLCGR